MSDDFFDKPFTEDTNVKLELYRDYLMEWFPVFISTPKPFLKVINVFDFFSGPGMDSNGTYGSPLIAVDVLNKYRGLVFNTKVEINLHFNDQNSDYIKELKENIKKIDFSSGRIKYHFHNEDFEELYPKLLPTSTQSGNLIFMDQFGIKYIDEERFGNLIDLDFTDILFFISSSTFNRFHNDNNITNIIGLSSEEIKSKPFYEIHRTIHKKYSEMIPSGKSYGLAPFSIMKGSNIYGLIFGSGHPLGMEKFLGLCWNKDEDTGEANFDIQGDKMLSIQPSLFEEDNENKKVLVFQRNLEIEILNGNLETDLKIYLYAINNGFINIHIKPVIVKLKNEGKIELKQPSFKYGTVWKKDRKPKQILVK